MHVFSNLGKFHDSCIFHTMWLESKNLDTGFGSWDTKFWFHSLKKLGNLTDFNNRLKIFLIVNRKISQFYVYIHIILRHTVLSSFNGHRAVSYSSWIFLPPQHRVILLNSQSSLQISLEIWKVSTYPRSSYPIPIQ